MKGAGSTYIAPLKNKIMKTLILIFTMIAYVSCSPNSCLGDRLSYPIYQEIKQIDIPVSCSTDSITYTLNTHIWNRFEDYVEILWENEVTGNFDFICQQKNIEYSKALNFLKRYKYEKKMLKKLGRKLKNCK